MAGIFNSGIFNNAIFNVGDQVTPPAVVVLPQSGVRNRRYKRFEKTDRYLEAMFPNLRDWNEDQRRYRQEKKKQLYPQTRPHVSLLELEPMMGLSFDPLKYSPDEIYIDKNLDIVAKLADEEDDEELIRFLQGLD